ncbi:MAG: IPT/TIG domain-containing protein [Thermomicrobiales bacterium]
MHRYHHARRTITVSTLFLLLGLAVPTVSVRAATMFTVGTCDESSFRTAVSDALAAGSGNTVIFGCSGYISLTSVGGGTISIGQKLTIDGNGHFPTIRGSGFTPFAVSSTVTNFTVNGLIVASVPNAGVSGNGGGIVNNGGKVTVTNSSFENLSATVGGGMYNDGGTVTVTNSAFITNRATGGGGGLYNYYGTMTVTNSTFSGNSANDGGGIVNNDGALIVTSSTFTGNAATAPASWPGPPGGGIYSEIHTGGKYTTLTNTLVANSPRGGDLGGAFLGYNNLIDDAASGTGLIDRVYGNIVGHPALLGAPCRCWSVVTDVPILPGSPAIDAGASVGSNVDPRFGTVLATDQRGYARLGTPDIGAVESQGFTMTLTSGDHQSAPRAAAFPAPLVATVSSTLGDQVTGGVVTFTGPDTGAGIVPSPVTAMIGGNFASGPSSGANGPASMPVTANSTVGAYPVIASVSRANPSVTFHLANDPLFTGISPPSGATSGGGAVSLTGHDFGTSAANVSVTFGDASAPVRSVTYTTITVTAPAHGVGAVDMVVTVNGATATLGQGYTYGVVQPLPGPQLPGGSGASVSPLPLSRPPGTPLTPPPSPLPPPR